MSLAFALVMGVMFGLVSPWYAAAVIALAVAVPFTVIFLLDLSGHGALGMAVLGLWTGTVIGVVPLPCLPARPLQGWPSISAPSRSASRSSLSGDQSPPASRRASGAGGSGFRGPVTRSSGWESPR